MEAKKLYDITAKKYDFRQSNPTTKRLRKEEEKLMEKFAFGKILDIGCGTGYHLEFLERKKMKIESLIGIDISFQMLSEARKKVSCDLIQAKAEELPFTDNSFDTILCFFTVLNLCDYNKAIEEIYRVLHKNGLAIISVASTWDKNFLPLRKRIFLREDSQKKRVRIEGYKIDFNLFSRNDFIKLFERNGFVLKKFSGLFILQRPYWGRFQDFSFFEKLKLRLEKIFPFNKLDKAACVYLAVFSKVFSSKE